MPRSAAYVISGSTQELALLLLKISRYLVYSAQSAMILRCRAYSTGIIRFFTKQIATEGFSTVLVNRGVLYDIESTKSIKPRKFGNIVKMRLENEKIRYSPHVKSCGINYHRFSKQMSTCFQESRHRGFFVTRVCV